MTKESSLGRAGAHVIQRISDFIPPEMKQAGSQLLTDAWMRSPKPIQSEILSIVTDPNKLLQAYQKELRKPEVRKKLPKTVVIIPDGNGRWATEQDTSRREAYEKGMKVLYEGLSVFREFQEVENVILWAWSEDNDKRGQEDRETVFGVMAKGLVEYTPSLAAQNCRITRVGSDANFTPELISAFDYAKSATSQNTGTNIIVAVNYGERYERLRFARKFKELGIDPNTATEEEIDYVQSKSREIPKIDLVARTSGEKRLSKFPFSNEAELVFIDTKLPGLRTFEIARSLLEFTERERPEGGKREERIK